MVALKVVIKVSLATPQLLPARAFRMLVLLSTLVRKSSVCCLNVSRGSKVTPSSLGVVVVGTSSPLMWIGRLTFFSWEAVVKMVA